MNTENSNKTKGYAFISYSSKNQQMADSFKALFNQNNIATWMAPGDIPAGATYTSVINNAIREASCFVLLLSEGAQSSQWVFRETERAVSTEKTIFTIKLDDVPMNDNFELMLSTSQAVAIRKIDTNDENIRLLLKAVSVYTNGIDAEMSPQPEQPGRINDSSKEQEVDRTDSIPNNSFPDNSFYEKADMHGTRIEYFSDESSRFVVIPEGVTEIGKNAFYKNSALRGISIPSSVIKIEEGAFMGCPYLCSITIASDNPVYYSEGNCCIERPTGCLVFGCRSSRIPEGVTEIGENAFNTCSNLTSIEIPGSVDRIAESAFEGCINLEDISLSDGITKIGSKAFAYCGLKELKIPKSVIDIDSKAFRGNKSIESILVDPDNPLYRSECNCCIETDTNSLVLGCRNSIIPDGIIRINEEAFYGCTQLSQIVLPDSVMTIGRSAFCRCISLESVILPAGLKKIDEGSFAYCSSLKELFIPSGVYRIGVSAFEGCSNLRSIEVSPENQLYRSEGNCIIYGDTLVFGFMNSVIPDGITQIADYAFNGCAGLTNIHFPDSVEVINSFAFFGTGLASVFIPRNIKYIGSFAFGNLCNICNIFCESWFNHLKWDRDWTDDSSNVYWKAKWDYAEDGTPQLLSKAIPHKKI